MEFSRVPEGHLRGEVDVGCKTYIIPWFCDLVLGKLNIPFTHPGKNMEEPETKGTFLQTL